MADIPDLPVIGQSDWGTVLNNYLQALTDTVTAIGITESRRGTVIVSLNNNSAVTHRINFDTAMSAAPSEVLVSVRSGANVEAQVYSGAAVDSGGFTVRVYATDGGTSNASPTVDYLALL